MKAARAGHLCTVQFLISKGASSTNCSESHIERLLYRLKIYFGLVKQFAQERIINSVKRLLAIRTK